MSVEEVQTLYFKIVMAKNDDFENNLREWIPKLLDYLSQKTPAQEL